MPASVSMRITQNPLSSRIALIAVIVAWLRSAGARCLGSFRATALRAGAFTISSPDIKRLVLLARQRHSARTALPKRGREVPPWPVAHLVDRGWRSLRRRPREDDRPHRSRPEQDAAARKS